MVKEKKVIYYSTKVEGVGGLKPPPLLPPLPHTPSTRSPTDSTSGGELIYLVIPFPTPGRPQMLLERLLFFFFFNQDET